MNSQEQKPRIVFNNDIIAARGAAEKALALTTMPRRKRMWGLRLYIDMKPAGWHSLSTGGLYRWTSKEAAEHFGKPALRNTGDWHAERLPFWLALRDSFMWFVLYSRRK